MRNVLITVLIVLNTLLIGWIAYGQLYEDKVVYVKADEVFNEFKLTKDLNAKYMTSQNARAAMLDTMEMGMRTLALKVDKEKYRQLEDVYYNKREEIEKQNTELFENYNKQVWTRINQYATEFSQKKGYKIMFGANGSGTLMYAEKEMDVTADLIKYMNEEYDGKN